ncbi:MAG: hypothetical protein LH468_08375 [Nocardioides sp.]|nr:hypothetical protein [Nocardioides sp.]
MPPSRHRSFLAAVLLCAGLVAALLTIATTPATANRLSESSGRPDPRLGSMSCSLMGRVSTPTGCSRTQCRVGGEQIRFSPNAETCLVGGRSGTSYGTEIDVRVCGELHRRWVPAVNFCASNPHRRQTLTYDAPQCRGGSSVYVTTSQIATQRATRGEKEGRYDVCVRPGEARELERVARRTGQGLRALVVQRSPALCNLQPQRAFVDGRCVREAEPVRPPTVLMVGDSLTWRGTDELARLRPDWVIDGQSGRNLSQLPDRLDRFEADRGTPTGLVVALGTNPAGGYTAARLRTQLARLPEATPVMVVLPYRGGGSNTLQQVRQVDRVTDLLKTVVAGQPGTCTADWRGLVARDPDLLVDGTHQIRRAEARWARLVSSSWQTCLGQQPAPTAARGASL